MNAVLERLRDQIKPHVLSLLTRVEESPLFERIAHKIENMEPSGQRWLKAAGSMAMILGLMMVTVYPVLSTFAQRYQISNYESLLLDMKAFNAETQTIRKPAPLPSGIHSFDMANATNLRDSLSLYLQQIGIPSDIFEISGNDFSILINLQELTLRQAMNITFQVDAWHPKLVAETLKISVNETSKDLITMELRLKFDPNATVASVSQNGAANSGLNAIGEEEDLTPTNGKEAPDVDFQEAPLKLPPGAGPGNPTLPFRDNDDLGDLPPPPGLDDDL